MLSFQKKNAERAGGGVKITSVHLYPTDKTREPFGIILMHRRIRESYANVRPLKHDFVRLRASFAGGLLGGSVSNYQPATRCMFQQQQRRPFGSRH